MNTHQMPWEVAFTHCITFVISATLTLNSNRIMERDQRRFYLHSLRDRLSAQENFAKANSDALTNLGNRHLLEDRAAEIWAAGDDRCSPISAIIFDIDHFKRFNDHYGHADGDSCIKRVAACALAELRDRDDLAIRYGGEEFLLLLPRTALGDGIRVAERLRRAIAALGIPHEGCGRGAVVTASFGVTTASVSATGLADLIAAADVALYAAKRNGRDQVFPPLLHPFADSLEQRAVAG